MRRRHSNLCRLFKGNGSLDVVPEFGGVDAISYLFCQACALDFSRSLDHWLRGVLRVASITLTLTTLLRSQNLGTRAPASMSTKNSWRSAVAQVRS